MHVLLRSERFDVCWCRIWARMLRERKSSISASITDVLRQCGSSFNNGGDGSLIDASRCSVACKGDDSTICGGGNALSLFKNPALAPVAESIPAGWSALGCLVDNFNSTRTMSTYRYTSGSMTNTLCINKCQSLNYRYAGTEYSVSPAD